MSYLRIHVFSVSFHWYPAQHEIPIWLQQGMITFMINVSYDTIHKNIFSLFFFFRDNYKSLMKVYKINKVKMLTFHKFPSHFYGLSKNL